MNILLTTVGGLTSVDIIKSLYENEEKRKIRIVGVDPFEFAVGRFFIDKFYKVPYSGKYEKEFIDSLLEIVEKENINLIIPCGNEDVLAVSKNIERFPVPVMVSSYSNLKKAFDKKEVYSTLYSLKSPLTPKYFIVKSKQELVKAGELLGYPKEPVCIKPAGGRGGRGVYILRENANFNSLFKNKPSAEIPLEALVKYLPEQFPEELIIMEYLYEPFYSFYALACEGEIKVSLTHIREWGNASQTFRGKVFFDQKLQDLLSPLIKHFKLSFCINVELGTSKDGSIKLFDLNPRIAASSGVDRYVGINFPYLALKLLLNEEFSLPDLTKIKGRFMRFFDVIWE
jgi:predicted ATP-grasp superfamily ATP-dependent carboligase